jgi:hypothetical protein
VAGWVIVAAAGVIMMMLLMVAGGEKVRLKLGIFEELRGLSGARCWGYLSYMIYWRVGEDGVFWHGGCRRRRNNDDVDDIRRRGVNPLLSDGPR